MQGDFSRHIAALGEAGFSARSVRYPREIESVDALVMPGGESTTLSILFDKLGLAKAVRGFARSGRPLFGTCAGAIMLCRRVSGDGPNLGVSPLSIVDAAILRNAFGRQVDSFEAPVGIDLPGTGRSTITGVFIRAPRFSSLGPGVKVIGRLGSEPVMIEQGNVILTSFHPELTGERRIHEYFLSKCFVTPEVRA